jgi:fibronectin type 3 domain-containing protein
VRNHEKAFRQIKDYYNDITKDNLKLIKALKAEVKSMKSNASKSSTEASLILQENKRLMEPLGVALKEVASLKASLRDREKDLLALSNARARAASLERELARATRERAAEEAEFAAVEKERDELRQNFEETVRTVQRQSELKNLVLRKKTASADEELLARQEQLQKVLDAARLDPVVVSNLEQKLNEILDSRNGVIRDLRYEVLRVSKCHDDAMRTLEAKLAEFGIPHDQGFVDSTAFLGSTTTGPAGLVTVPDQ